MTISRVTVTTIIVVATICIVVPLSEMVTTTTLLAEVILTKPVVEATQSHSPWCEKLYLSNMLLFIYMLKISLWSCKDALFHGKNVFGTATKLRTTNIFFVAATKIFAAATKRFVNRTKHFVVVAKCFCYPYLNN